MAALPRAGRARRKVEVAESSIHLRETERQRIRVCDKCGNTDPTWCCSCEITPSGKLTRIRIAPPASDAEQLKEQIKVLQLGNTRLKLQTERRKAVIGKGKRGRPCPWSKTTIPPALATSASPQTPSGPLVTRCTGGSSKDSQTPGVLQILVSPQLS